MHWVNWTIVVGLLVILTSMAAYSRKYTRSVTDFLAANRTAGRYLICIGDGMAALGAITIIMMFEMFYKAGFPVVWWDMMRLMIIPPVLALSGWIIYRFRETRALTLAQFFEMRYSKNFRIFAGIITWFAGIVNFGIFPAVGARFFIYFLGFQETTLTYIIFLIVLIAFALYFTFVGGQIAVMLTDFIQGVFCNLFFIIILISVFNIFSWEQVVEVLSSLSKENASMIHPFDIGNAESFNTGFYLIMAFLAAYIFMAWQGTQGYNASAINAHEARMGKSLATWRLLLQSVFVLVMPLCALTFMHHPDFAGQASEATKTIATISDEVIKTQVSTTIILRHILPIGAMGGLCGIMLAAFISTHNTYLHSWGSIFIQDVVMPFRKTPFPAKEHLRWLRYSILGVAVFIFLFSIFFRQTEYIIMFFQITGSIFFGGAGSVIIGGLYWKRGTTAGAWSGMITGGAISMTGVILRQLHASSPFENEILLYIASRSGNILAFWASLAAIVAYICGSLLTCKTPFNLDKILHRGKYAITEDRVNYAAKPVSRIRALIGMGPEFNRRDKVLYMALISWMAILIIGFVGISIYNMLVEVSQQWWIKFWHVYILVTFSCGCIVAVWFTIGGIIDVRKMFKRLSVASRDTEDDGRVSHEN